MSQEKSFSISPMLPIFLACAALGAVLVALTTPKTGPELRGELKGLGLRAKRKAGELADDAGEFLDDWKERTACAAEDMKDRAVLAASDMKERTVLAAGDLKRGASEAVKDLRG